ncbi:hypothetical protein DdX_12716 [Ditylenchus destructor]|uniref:Uncharacterized protein n=1 Tax=Ditylenchus destructor TaxID=166010 RepID=A0AAD4MV33_9BILA|nr:hypothetical protein DdX_12716 [Ditylenchus destructor]
MENTPDPVMQQIISTNGLDQTGKNDNGEQSNVSNVENISDESRDNTETPTGAKKPIQNKNKQRLVLVTHYFISLVRVCDQNKNMYLERAAVWKMSVMNQWRQRTE